MVLATGQRLGHYEVLAAIGSGGMGAVYRAHDTLLRRTVAIKVLHGDLAGDARAHLLREARAASALSHPNICTVHSVEDADGFAFIVMEYVSGQPLDQISARLSSDQISRYGTQIARALDHAHKHHVVHRDLKRSNIMITADGDAVVLDFGIAGQLGDEGQDGRTATIADTGDLAGTIAYMAPERLRGARGDERSDIWSLGVVLYEMVTRSSPFKGDTAYALSAAILEEPPPPLPSTVSGPLKHVIARCLEKDRARRYHTAGEVAAGLELSQSVPSRATSASVRKWAALVGGLVLVAAVALVTLYRREPPASSVTQAVQSVAILPLRVIGGTSDEAHLGVGIADAIITRLAGVRHIALRPTAAVLSYATASPDPASVGAALNVEQVIFGTIQPTPAAYRVSLQVVRAADGSVAWGRTLDVSREDLLALQDTVAEQIVTALSLQLTSSQRERLNRRYTENTEAYTLYVRGRALLLNYTEANMRQAIDSFERALAIDPSYTLARAGLATACAWFSTRYAYGSNAITWGERAEREARAALAADASLAEAHLAIASAAGTLYRGFDWKTTLEETDRAIELDPGMELAYLARMRAFYHLGQFSRAAEEQRRARLLNTPFNAEIARLEIAVRLFSGEFAAARDLATELLPQTDAPVVRQYLGLARYYLGDGAGAREMLASARQGDQPDVRSQASLASIEAAMGDKEAARKRAVDIERGSYMDHHVAYSLAATWAQLGEPAISMRWLQQAMDTGFPCLPWFAKDPLLDPIRKDPSFMRLMASMGSEVR
jgi:eukaryotic-like serine/threonine-protein kinase